MVNVMRANCSFYPTDHCGYLRVKKAVIEPFYLAYVLEIAGHELCFSRVLRASIDRVKKYYNPTPTPKKSTRNH
ncbi:hypothetical protein [Helicobacter cetorum]|uniref:hypothetical protein n=1 Tax=Helicobacter cetorum TaxID=138563 RepID=UPI000CF0FBE4|nr:hypothetical protein [Helicobacter cetorum]